VLTGGMLQGLEKFLHCSLHHSVPNVVIDMGGAIFNSLTAAMFARHEEFFSLSVTICVNPSPDATDCHVGEEITGKMFLFLGPDAVKDILALTCKIAS
jgi:chemotaxis protein CheY-P-specific phosphatase CheC